MSTSGHCEVQVILGMIKHTATNSRITEGVAVSLPCRTVYYRSMQMITRVCKHQYGCCIYALGSLGPVIKRQPSYTLTNDTVEISPTIIFPLAVCD